MLIVVTPLTRGFFSRHHQQGILAHVDADVLIVEMLPKIKPIRIEG
jgi:hypothetical protein